MTADMNITELIINGYFPIVLIIGIGIFFYKYVMKMMEMQEEKNNKMQELMLELSETNKSLAATNEKLNQIVDDKLDEIKTTLEIIKERN